MNHRQIDKNNPVPLYLQLANILRAELRTGAFKHGEALPAERVLREAYDVSRATVREAVSQLKKEDIIETRRGAGNFVKIPSKVDRDLLGFHDFDVQIEESGHTNKVVILSFEESYKSPKVSNVLGRQDEEVIKVTRLRLADDEPLFIEKIYFPKDIFRGLRKEDFSSTSVFSKKIACEYGIEIGEVMIQLEPVLLSESEANFLNVEKLPAAGLLNERVTYNTRHDPIVYSKWLFSGNKCRHVLKINPRS